MRLFKKNIYNTLNLLSNLRSKSLGRVSKVRFFGLLSIAITISLATITILSSPPVYADPQDNREECEAAGGTWNPILPFKNCSGFTLPELDWTPTQQATQWAYVNAIQRCVRDAKTTDRGWEGSSNHINDSHAKSGEWFFDGSGYRAAPTKVAGSYLASDVEDDGNIKCSSLLPQAYSIWEAQFGSYLNLLCSFVNVRDNGSSCETGNGDFVNISAQDGLFYGSIQDEVWLGNSRSATDAGYYVLYREAFFKGCKAKENPDASGKFKYSVKLVNEDGTPNEKVYEGLEQDHEIKTYTTEGLNTLVSKCSFVADQTNLKSSAYAQWIADNPDKKDTGPEISTEPGTSGGGDDSTSCAVEGIGWIVCPVINFMADLNDKALEFLGDQFLSISPGFFESGGASETAWKSFRDIANVAFVVVFLLIIYSQITGGGFTNYGIKKLLPKIIIVAVLVNTSFFLCQIAIDLSNIVGNSVAALMNTIPTTSADQATQAVGWKDVSGKVLAATGGIVIALVLLSVIGPAALLALALVVLILIARKALIILLVVISPLAFVAYLLPNTEQYFKKWWKVFSTLLLLYPIIGLIFGASQLAAKVIVASGPDDPMIQLTALGVMAMPLFAVPLVLKGVNSSMGTLGAKLSGIQDRATGAASKGAKDRLKRRAENVEARAAGSGHSALRFAGGYRNRRAFGREKLEKDTARRQDQALSSHVIDNPRYDTREQAAAYQKVDKAWGDEVNAHQALYSNRSTDEKTLLSDMNNSKLTEQQRAAAAGMLMKGSRKGQNSAVRAAVAMAQSGDENVGGIQKQMNSDMGSRIPMGLGAGARAELGRGKLGVNPMPNEDKPPGTDSKYSFDDEIANRAVAKVSAAGIPDLDPDDLQEILNAATSGRIQGDDLDTLHASITTAEGDARINTKINDSARVYLNQISAITKKDAQDAAAKTYGNNI